MSSKGVGWPRAKIIACGGVDHPACVGSWAGLVWAAEAMPGLCEHPAIAASDTSQLRRKRSG